MFRGIIVFVVVLTAACIAETLTMPKDEIPPVITLVQDEPEYHESTEIVGQENQYNIEKFSNPVLRGGDVPPVSTTTESHAASSYVPTAEGRLTKSKGVHQGPSGRETWYSLDMTGVIKIMRSLGYSEEDYPYTVDEHGIKRFGGFVMVAANLQTRPKGTILPTSWGDGIVVDSGSFTKTHPDGVDIATNWSGR